MVYGRRPPPWRPKPPRLGENRAEQPRLHARIVNYADDFVISCRGTADQAMTIMRDIMVALKLTVNETKTHVRRVPAEPFDFLGYQPVEKSVAPASSR